MTNRFESQKKVLDAITLENLSRLENLSDKPSEKTIIKDMMYQKSLLDFITMEVEKDLIVLEQSETIIDSPVKDQISRRNYILEKAVETMLQQIMGYTGYQRGDWWMIVDKNDQQPQIGQYLETGQNTRFVNAHGFGAGYNDKQRKKKPLLSKNPPMYLWALNTGNLVHIYDSQECIDFLVEKGLVAEDWYQSEKEDYTQKKGTNDPEVDGYDSFSEWFNRTVFPLKWHTPLGKMEVSGFAGFDKLTDHNPSTPLPDYKLWLSQTMLEYTVNVLINSKLVQQIADKNREIQEAQSQLVEAAEDKARYEAHKGLIGSVAHRLRNSMALAAMNVQTIKSKHKEGLSEKVMKMLDQAQGSIQLTSDNIKAFTDYEKIEQEKQDTPVNVSQTIETVLKAYEHQIQEKNVAVQVSCAPDVEVYANKHHVYLVFDNLVKNSLEAIAGAKNLAHQPAITIAVQRNNDRIALDYEDNGPGIPDKVLEQLGKKIVTTKPTTGLGIGVLSIFDVFRVYGGSIHYEHRKEGGVTTKAVFPTHYHE
jgi:signal transduction histidine kinase